jgi:hypothetical protein
VRIQPYAPRGLARKNPEIHFHAELDDESPAAWAIDIDEVVFRGSFFMEDVVFFHWLSRTAIFGNLIQRHCESRMSGWKGLVMRLDGLVGDYGSTPREWRASFLHCDPARAERKTVVESKAERLLIAHGQRALAGATEIIASALRWI